MKKSKEIPSMVGMTKFAYCHVDEGNIFITEYKHNSGKSILRNKL